MCSVLAPGGPSRGRVSPDRRWVLFERDTPDGSSSVGVDGTGERGLDLACTDLCVATNNPSWTPDGRHVVYQRVEGPFDEIGNAASAALWIYDLDTNTQRRLSDPAIDGEFEEARPSFAPGGYMVVVRGNNLGELAVFRLDLNARNPHQLTPWELEAELPVVSPAEPGPTADLVVFETFGHGAREGATVGQRIATVPATCGSLDECASQIRYVTAEVPLPVQFFNPSWSPDGREIVFVRFDIDVVEEHGLGDIWISNWNGSHQRAFSADPRFEFRPDWGPEPR